MEQTAVFHDVERPKRRVVREAIFLLHGLLASIHLFVRIGQKQKARVRLIRRVTSPTARSRQSLQVGRGLPGSKCTGLLAKGVDAHSAIVSLRRGPRLNIFNNMTVTCVAPFAAGVEKTEVAT